MTIGSKIGRVIIISVISSMKKGLADERIKWTNPSCIHITLAFLGDTDDDITEAVRKMLNTRCGGSGKFELMLMGSGVFKNFNDPKVIWTGVESSEKLMSLNKMITEGLKDQKIITCMYRCTLCCRWENARFQPW